MNFDKYINDNEFTMLYEQFLNYDFNKFCDEINNYSWKTKNIGTYLFIKYLLSIQNDIRLHELSFSLLIHPFCHTPGAYFASLYHVRKCIEISDDIKYKELLIFLNEVPDKVVSDEEANQVRGELNR